MKSFLSYNNGIFNANIVYKFAYLLYTISALINATYLLDEYTIGILTQLVKYTCIVFLIIYAFYKYKFRKNVLLGALLFGSFFLINALLNDFSLMLMILFIFLFPNNLNPKNFGKKIVVILSIIYIIVIALSMLGLIYNYVEYRGLDGTIRHAMGFISPNTCGTYFLYIILIAIYSWEPRRWKNYILCSCVLMSFYIYIMTNSRMAIFYELLLFFIIMCEKNFNLRKMHKYLYPAVYMAFLLMMLLSISVIVFFSNNQNEWYVILNQLFSGRLVSIVQFYNEYGISIWGNYIELHGIREATTKSVAWAGIDNSYVFLLIKYGMIIFTMFFMGIVYATRELKKRNDYQGALYLIFICLIGLTEKVMYDVAINYGIIIFASLIACSYIRGEYKE